MDMDFGIYSLYSNLINTKVKFCSLCFKIVKEDAACIQDSVILGIDEDAECFISEEISIHCILQEILSDQTASYLSENDAVCDSCIQSAISSYKFIKMCSTNMERMATAVDLFTTNIDDPNLDVNGKNTLFLSINFEDSTCIQHFDTTKFNNNKSALSRFQSLFRSYTLATNNDGNTLYHCTKCPASYPNAISARRHFNSKHIDSDIRKGIQKMKTVSVRGKTHTRVKKKQTSLLPSTCIFCHANFGNQYFLTKHILTDHSIEIDKDFSDVIPDRHIFNHVFTVLKDISDVNKYKCVVCGKLYKSYTIVTTHFKKQHMTMRDTDAQFICSHCGKECYDENALRRHEENHMVKFTCPTCNKVYKSKVCFNQHVCFKDTARSEMKRDMVCDHCGKKFVSKHSLKIHIRYYHGPQSQQFKCEHCPKTFGAFSQWKGHQVKHTRERNFTCDLCGNVFVTRMALVYHTRIHTGERPYQCKYCDQRFLSSSRRADHVKRHHIVTTVSCDICGATVKETGLAKHVRRHNNANSTLYINKDGKYGKKGSAPKVKKVKRLRYYESDSE